MISPADQDAGLLREVHRRRAELRSSMGALERALASPSRAGASLTWSARLRDAARSLYDDFRQHVAITEGPEGLYAELAQHSPRLAHTVGRLAEEHTEIERRLEQLLTLIEVNEASPDVRQARRTGTQLLALLMQHRQRGADLVFEAYQVDIGGET